jgi:hypothetical protein
MAGIGTDGLVTFGTGIDVEVKRFEVEVELETRAHVGFVPQVRVVSLDLFEVASKFSLGSGSDTGIDIGVDTDVAVEPIFKLGHVSVVVSPLAALAR